MADTLLIPFSRAARLIAISREAQDQSVDAIRRSLRLLREPDYPAARPPAGAQRPSPRAAAPETEGSGLAAEPRE